MEIRLFSLISIHFLSFFIYSYIFLAIKRRLKDISWAISSQIYKEKKITLTSTILFSIQKHGIVSIQIYGAFKLTSRSYLRFLNRFFLHFLRQSEMESFHELNSMELNMLCKLLRGKIGCLNNYFLRYIWETLFFEKY